MGRRFCPCVIIREVSLVVFGGGGRQRASFPYKLIAYFIGLVVYDRVCRFMQVVSRETPGRNVNFAWTRVLAPRLCLGMRRFTWLDYLVADRLDRCRLMPLLCYIFVKKVNEIFSDKMFLLVYREDMIAIFQEG